MRKSMLQLCVLPVFLLCASAQAAQDEAVEGKVVHVYARKSANIYVDWKYGAARPGAAQVAEVVAAAALTAPLLVLNPGSESWHAGDVVDVHREVAVLDREAARAGTLRAGIPAAVAYAGTRTPAPSMVSFIRTSASLQ